MKNVQTHHAFIKVKLLQKYRGMVGILSQTFSFTLQALSGKPSPCLCPFLE